MSMILVKMPVRPDRQRVLVGEEGAETDMRLRQWANKKAFAEGLTGEAAAARRDELMREAVKDAGKHGLTFMDDPIPFDVDDEKDPDAWMGDESPKHFENMKEQGYPKGGPPEGPFIGEGDEPPEGASMADDGSWYNLDDGDPKVQQWQSSKTKKPLPTGQTSLDDFAPKSFDPHPGDAMLKAVRARLGW